MIRINKYKKDLPKRLIFKVDNKLKLTKSEMSYQINKFDYYNVLGLYPDSFKREEILKHFNEMFNLKTK